MRKEFTIPPHLQPKDRIAIVSPSSGCAQLFPWVFELGIERLRTVFNLEPIIFPSALKNQEYLSRNPEARADDINEAFSDSSINGIIATLGGYDEMRILRYIEQDLLDQNPKIFMGYSDSSNLHCLLWSLGIVSYYGRHLLSQFGMQHEMHEYTIEYIKRSLFETKIGALYEPSEYTDFDLDWADQRNLRLKRPMEKNPGWYWHNCSSQQINGRLWGGCLEILDALLAADKFIPHLDEFNDIVLYLETSEELPTEGFVYRFIAALGERGILAKIKALLIGIPKTQFINIIPAGGRENYIINQRTTIINALADYDAPIPTIFNMSFGHTDPQMILPNGGLINIDCANKRISLH